MQSSVLDADQPGPVRAFQVIFHCFSNAFLMDGCFHRACIPTTTKRLLAALRREKTLCEETKCHQAVPTPPPPHARHASHLKCSSTTPLRWKRRANIYRWGEREKTHRRQAGGRFLRPCSGAVGKFLIPPSLWFICSPDPPCEVPR